MNRNLRALALLTALLAILVAAIGAGSGAAAPKLPKAPKAFFGIAPQTPLNDEDIRYMRAGGVASIRVGVPWYLVQPEAGGAYDWSELDATVELASRGRLRVLPFVYGTPTWLAADWRTLPLSGKAVGPWRAFLRAAVERYGPGGDFWAEHAPGNATGAAVISRPLPIRTWQVWNEANYFYFAKPVSPSRYAKLAQLSGRAIKSADRGATVVLSGLFGEPDEQGRRGMDAVPFLERVYRKKGIKSSFDGIALHPYAVNAKDLARMVEEMHEVAKDNGDRPGIYLTEFGWGSQNNFKQVAYEQGIRGQVRQLRNSYRFLLRNRRKLNIKETYWFSWKDLPGSCNFCDSVGLFRGGEGFRPKPAWKAFVQVTGGRPRP